MLGLLRGYWLLPASQFTRIDASTSQSKETGEIRHYPLDAFERVIQINLIGTFRCIAKSAAGMLTLPPLDDGERGAIVNTASVAAQDGQIGQAAYNCAGIGGAFKTAGRDTPPRRPASSG